MKKKNQKTFNTITNYELEGTLEQIKELLTTKFEYVANTNKCGVKLEDLRLSRESARYRDEDDYYAIVADVEETDAEYQGRLKMEESCLVARRREYERLKKEFEGK